MRSEASGWTVGLDQAAPVFRSWAGIDLIHLLGYPAGFSYAAFAVFVGFPLIRLGHALVGLGHALLGLLRDVDNYRSHRPRGRRGAAI